MANPMELNAAFFEKLLDSQSLGFACLSAQGQIRRHNTSFAKFVQAAGNLDDQNLEDCIPEAVGLDQILVELSQGQRQSFVIDRINRSHPSGGLNYFDLSLHSTGNIEIPLVCLIKDVTGLALFEQDLHQKRIEIRLLEGMLDAREDFSHGGFLGDAEPIQQIRATIARISNIPSATVILEGESGTGKNLVAGLIHYSSRQSQMPLVEINCAAIPENLLESELFGYEKGAFTNATSSKQGLFEKADGGTLFLDEIGEMPLPLQAKLLSFLETRRIRRLGGVKEKEIQVRLIAATNRNLKKMVQEGKFREDLFFRLNVIRIIIPPLRDLGDDIAIIAKHFIDHFNVAFERRVTGLSDEAQQKLRNHDWPGNVRELRNMIERAMIFAEDGMLSAKELHMTTWDDEEVSESPLLRFKLTPDGIPFEEIEKKILEDALRLSEGNQSKAAKLLRLSRDTFRYRLEKHQLL